MVIFVPQVYDSFLTSDILAMNYKHLFEKLRKKSSKHTTNSYLRIVKIT